MPSAKYYRTGLPLDLLQIIGNFAGDVNYKLKFTLSPKRKFLSSIVLHWRDASLYSEYRDQVILRADSWVPIRLNCIPEVLHLLTTRSKLPNDVIKDSLRKITCLLLEVHDYRLKGRRGRNTW